MAFRFFCNGKQLLLFLVDTVLIQIFVNFAQKLFMFSVKLPKSVLWNGKDIEFPCNEWSWLKS